MDSFNFDFDTDSTLTNDTNSNSSDLDWTAFQSASPTITSNSPFSPTWLAQQDDAVAPDNRSSLMTTPHDDGIYFEIEHFFNGLNQQQQPQQQTQATPPSSLEEAAAQGIIEPIHVNIHIPDQTRNDLNQFETSAVCRLSLDSRQSRESLIFSIASIIRRSATIGRVLVYQLHSFHVFPPHVRNAIINCPIMQWN